MNKNYRFHGVNLSIDSSKKEIFKIFENCFNVRELIKTDRAKIRLIFHRKKNKLFNCKASKSHAKIFLKRKRNIFGLFKNDKLYFNDRKSHVLIEYRKNKASFFIHPDTLKIKKLFSHTILPLTLIELLKKFGFYYIHASCADIDGKGIIFTGNPGSGKSSACYTLVRRGAKWISDDAVLIKNTSSGIKAYSFIKEFSLFTGPKSPFVEFRKIPSVSKKELSKLSTIRYSFVSSTVPKALVLIGKPYKPGSDLKVSEIIGKIIAENEFLMLDKKYANKVITNLDYLSRQCIVSSLDYAAISSPDKAYRKIVKLVD